MTLGINSFIIHGSRILTSSAQIYLVYIYQSPNSSWMAYQFVCNLWWRTLQHTAAHCSTLQHTATHCNTLQHPATHCNTLQHTATHCNTLQLWWRNSWRVLLTLLIIHTSIIHEFTYQYQLVIISIVAAYLTSPTQFISYSHTNI